MTPLYKILFPNVFWNTKNNKVLLTIDDSPTNKGTEKVLKILNYYSIKVLFFVKGNECEHYSNLLKEIYSENHCIGNHSFNHNSMLFMNNKK
jgi:peptidoglycan/xylan/chitin deacetylase (PgdA/CDA1 family)